MVKKSIFTLVFLAVIGWVSAQSLQFEFNGHVYAQNEVVICTYVEEWGEMIQDMQIRNLTDASQDIMISREIVQIVDGTENSFCWGNCFAPFVDVSPRPQVLEAGAVSEQGLLSFHQMLDPTYSGDPANFAVGTSIVKYFAYPASNEEDKVCIEIWFAYGAESIDENKISFSHAFPNPASSVVRFNYQLPVAGNVSVSVYNLLGQEVLSQQLEAMQGQAVLPVADLIEGIYFCNLKVDGRAVKTEKFVVKRY